MISKILTGNSFAACCAYVCGDKKRSEILFVDGVREHDPQLMADDFEMVRKLRPSKAKAVFHGILSFYPGEQIDNQRMVEIAKRYLAGIGINNTPVAITSHLDKAFKHIHIISSLVDYDGKSIKENWIGLNGKKVAQRLTQEFGLIPANKKELAKTNLQSLNNEQHTRYSIFEAITKTLPTARNLDELRTQLAKKGIGTKFKYKIGTSVIQGISFSQNDLAFKGSHIDRKFSIAGLQKILSGNDLEITKIPSIESRLPVAPILKGSPIDEHDVDRNRTKVGR